MGLNATEDGGALADARLRALLAAGLPGGTAPVHTALLLLSVATGQGEVRLYSRAADGRPGHETDVFRSQPPHGLFALGLIAALHAHRLHHWRPSRDAYTPTVTRLGSRSATGQIGWAIDLHHLHQEDDR